MFGLGYERPFSTAEFVETYHVACERSAPTLIAFAGFLRHPDRAVIGYKG
jgi:hypothetical protein